MAQHHPRIAPASSLAALPTPCSSARSARSPEADSGLVSTVGAGLLELADFASVACMRNQCLYRQGPHECEIFVAVCKMTKLDCSSHSMEIHTDQCFTRC